MLMRSRLSVRVMECLADGLGLPTDTFTSGTVDPGVGDSQSVLRFLHYHSTEGKSFGPNFWRAGAHADFDVLTMVSTVLTCHSCTWTDIVALPEEW